MTITKVKAMVAKGLTVCLLAGAFALAAPAKAEAQQFAVGVQFGSPYGNDYYARQRYEEYRRQQAALARRQAEERHAAWVRQQAYNRNAYAHRGNDRDDHRDWDRDHR